MTRPKPEGAQPLLFPIGDLGLPDDPVGAALASPTLDDGAVWRDAMALFGRLAWNAYHKAHARQDSEPES